MFVVRRSFRNNGQMILPGSVVEPGSIKRFKTRLKDRDIIEVTAHNFDTCFSYFKQKFGVNIQLPEVVTVAEAVTETKPERIVVKAVYKD